MMTARGGQEQAQLRHGHSTVGAPTPRLTQSPSGGLHTVAFGSGKRAVTDGPFPLEAGRNGPRPGREWGFDRGSLRD